ncbi:hypothetical protein B0H14DRAFT_2740654, partial [Mycena olivaceomarginata]
EESVGRQNGYVPVTAGETAGQTNAFGDSLIPSVQNSVVHCASDFVGEDLSASDSYLVSDDLYLVSSDAAVSSGSHEDASGTAALATHYRTPATTYLDKCVHHFIESVLGGRLDRDGRLHVEFASCIREYQGNIYVASVGTGDTLHWETSVLPGPKLIQDVAKQFYDQTRDPIFRRTVFGHKRFIRDEALLGESTRWQSRFRTTGQSYDGVDFDWISAPDTDIWLPNHQQLKMIMDHNCMNAKTNFRRLIVILTPLIKATIQNLLVDYVYAIVAVLHKLPTVDKKKLYLKHQRTYLSSTSTVEYSVDQVNTPERRYHILQQAIERIDNVFGTLSKSLDSFNNGYPSTQQLAAARALGLTVSRWYIGTHQQLAAFHGQPRLAEIRLTHSARYMEQINPVWVALGSTMYPTLKLEYMEPEYALYANKTRLRVEELERIGQVANLPDLSSALTALPSPKIY